MTMDGVTHEVGKWDLLIAHPPCTYLSNAGARHLWKGHELQADRVMLGIQGRDLFMRFWWADVPRICVENPVPSRVFCLPEYAQSIQPYQFGHPYTKKTCLWLKGLPPLIPTDIVEPTATWCPSGSYSHKQAFSGISGKLPVANQKAATAPLRPREREVRLLHENSPPGGPCQPHRGHHGYSGQGQGAGR